MARGGYRPNSGRKPGSKNKPRPAKPIISEGPDKATAHRVAMLSGAGLAPADIAVALNMPELELRARFGRELDHGPVIMRALAVTALADAAAKGVTAASKTLLDLMDNPDTPLPQAEAPPVDAAPHIQRALRILDGDKS